MLKINITEKVATVWGKPAIVCGNSDYVIEFDFDDEWADRLTKTARFAYNKGGLIRYQDIVFTGNTVTVPVLDDITEVFVGVFSGNLATTTPARIPCAPSIRCGTGAPADPPPSQYDQIIALIEDGALKGDKGVGQFTVDGTDYAQEGYADVRGEKFNDYDDTDGNLALAPGSHAEGTRSVKVEIDTSTTIPTVETSTIQNIAGCKGYEIKSTKLGSVYLNPSITINNNRSGVITLVGHIISDTTTHGSGAYAVGDTFSLITDTNADDCGKITEIKEDANTTLTYITVDKIPDTVQSGLSVASPLPFIFKVNNKPLTGTYAIGLGAHTEGVGNQALSDGAHAEGYETIASGTHSHSEGVGTWASGKTSHAEGQDTIASAENAHAEGAETIANGLAAHSEGKYVFAYGDYSHAEGSDTRTFGIASHAEGHRSVVKELTLRDTILGKYTVPQNFNWNNGNGAHAEGVATVASNNGAHAEGHTTYAIGSTSHAEGYETIASGTHSHSEGVGTWASGKTSHAEGQDTIASAENAHAEGRRTEASGVYSHTEGSDTKATSNGAHAEGVSTLASGSTSHAEGYSSQATGAHSHAQNNNTRAIGAQSTACGNSTIAGYENQFVIGKHNDNNANNIFEVGNGTYDARKNAFEVAKSGTGKLGGNPILTVSSGQEVLLYIGDTQPAATAGKVTVWISLSGNVKIIQ